MSKSGEIRSLTKLIKPHIGVITNIGEAHIENFNNIHGIAKAKSEIIENIQANGTIVLNRDDKFFNFLYKKAKFYKLKVATFGTNKQSDVCLKKDKKKKNKSEIFIKINNQTLNFFIKDLNIHNILASLTVLNELRLDFNKIIKKI